MQIQFTKEQYEKLIKSVYLGCWLANAHRTDDTIKEYEEVEEYIFSFAKDFGLEKYVDDSEEIDGRRFFPTRYFEEEIGLHDLIDEYDEDNFWDELFYRMSDRDFFRVYSQKEFSKMDLRERFEKEEPFREKWDKEINEYGIERLEIKEKI